MKNVIIKSIFIFLVFNCLIFINALQSQGSDSYWCYPDYRASISTNPEHPINTENPKKINTFDWTKDSFDINSSYFRDIIKVVSPFYQYNNPAMSYLALSKDMYPEDGWELLNYDFGFTTFYPDSQPYKTDYPIFVLYNKYFSKIRVFVLLKAHIDTGYNYYIDFIGNFTSINSDPFTSTISTVKPVNSLDNYSEYTLKYFYPFYSTPGFWHYGDIDVIYDPCSCQLKEELWFNISLYRYKIIVIDGKQYDESSEYGYRTYPILLPGSSAFEFYTKSKDNDILNTAYPYYNNILGTFNLLHTPEINYKSRFISDYEYEFKLNTNLEYVVNPAAGFVMDSINMMVRYVVEFSKYPALKYDNSLKMINDTTYESIDIPIACAKDFTLKFKSPFSEPPKTVYLKLSCDFIKKDKSGRSSHQYLVLPFNANLTIENTKLFTDNYWQNTYSGDCKTYQPPSNINNDAKMEEFCYGKNEIYVDRRGQRIKQIITDSVMDSGEIINQTRLYDVYPNPATSIINIDYAIESENDVKIYLIDELGKKVQDFGVLTKNNRGRYSNTFSIASICQGIYFCVFETNTRKDVKLFVKIN